jgi:hypothetical protein
VSLAHHEYSATSSDLAGTTMVTQDPNESFVPPTPGRRNAARAVILLSILVTLVALATIFYRSFAVIEPTSAVIVIGDPSLDGAEIVVRASDFSSGSLESTATLSADNNFQTPVLLRPGVYLITITYQDRVLLKEQFSVEPYRARQYFLGLAAQNAQSVPRAKTRPATRKGD